MGTYHSFLFVGRSVNLRFRPIPLPTTTVVCMSQPPPFFSLARLLARLTTFFQHRL